MKAVSKLPDGYREIDAVDLQKDKKLSLLVNGLAILIGVALAVPMHFVVPLSTLFVFTHETKAARHIHTIILNTLFIIYYSICCQFEASMS